MWFVDCASIWRETSSSRRTIYTAHCWSSLYWIRGVKLAYGASLNVRPVKREDLGVPSLSQPKKLQLKNPDRYDVWLPTLSEFIFALSKNLFFEQFSHPVGPLASVFNFEKSEMFVRKAVIVELVQKLVPILLTTRLVQQARNSI